MNAFWCMFAKKKPYGDPVEAFCQSSVGVFVLDAFGYQEFQSGSSFDVRVDPDRPGGSS